MDNNHCPYYWINATLFLEFLNIFHACKMKDTFKQIIPLANSTHHDLISKLNRSTAQPNNTNTVLLQVYKQQNLESCLHSDRLLKQSTHVWRKAKLVSS